MALPHPLAADMAKHLARWPLLDLESIEEPWLYLRKQGFTHAQLEQHIEEAIRIVCAERAGQSLQDRAA